MVSEMRIHQIDSSHIGDLIRIADATNLNPWTAAHYLDEIKNPDGIMFRLESENSETAGFIVGRIVPSMDGGPAEDAEIYNIGVALHFQRQGFGQALINRFFTACRPRKVRNVWLEVRVSNNAARQLYGKNGFITVATRKGFYADPHEDGLLMKCELKYNVLPIN